MPKRPPDPSLNAPAPGEASASWVSAAVVTTEPDATPSALPTEIPQDWHQLAEAKGFSITARIKDRFHLELRCKTCAQTHVSKIYTLRTAQPTCPGCMADRRVTEALEAGLVWLRGDPDNPHYSFYRAPCGHELRRQHELILRVGQGRTGVRCTICLAQSDAEKAALRGWVLIGTDPQGRAGYRLYGHCCGARQSITRQNMQTGRFDCAECGPGWAAAPSWIYVMAFTLSSGRQVVKLGFARDPDSRLNWQLQQVATCLAASCAGCRLPAVMSRCGSRNGCMRICAAAIRQMLWTLHITSGRSGCDPRFMRPPSRPRSCACSMRSGGRVQPAEGAGPAQAPAPILHDPGSSALDLSVSVPSHRDAPALSQRTNAPCPRQIHPIQSGCPWPRAS